ncbi:hypothetical protein B0675_27050 [Streptomyces sp. M41(2017)]|nr:hypothetical protein B0675_27050 [Streptomyces sp. M41(2017)]
MTISATFIRLARGTATAAAVAVLMAATTSAGHAAPAGNDPTPQAATRFVDAASLPAKRS